MGKKQISAKQLTANRKNALKGGVKTPQGKMISKYNAMKHGLLCKEVLIQGEDNKTLSELERRIRATIKPVGEIEHFLVDRIVANIWRLKRAMKVERNSMEWEKNYKEEFSFAERDNLLDQLDPQKKREKIRSMIANPGTERMLRYESMIERSIYKALHELQRIQSARAGDKPFAPLAIDLDVSGGA